MTGNKYQREEDMPALPGVLGLEIVRYHNSAYVKANSPNGPMGRDWKLSYETELFDQAGRIQILQADGTRVIFSYDPKNPSLCSTPLPSNGNVVLSRQRNGTTDYTWTWPDGRRLHFNNWGKLDRITAPTGEAVALQYDLDNVLVKVTDPQGRSLQLGYLGRDEARTSKRFRGVQYIDSPVGRFQYEYGGTASRGTASFDPQILAASMLRVRLPTGYDPSRKAHSFASRGTTTSTLSRVYHHEDWRFPWLLTGISIESVDAKGKPLITRFATFGYDESGRANLSTHANNVDKVTLEFREAGTTVLTNSLGQRTTYRHAIVGDQRRILEVRGAGCSTCGESNVRYGYDGLGQLVETTKLSVKGEPVSAVKRELDKLGRTVKVSTVDFKNGKPGAAQWKLRLVYAGDGYAPVDVIRPSVVPGKELHTRITYNGTGQPLSVTERGWIPTFDGKEAAGHVERTVTYSYDIINGRSLLTRIDGPLPNGKSNSPADSDVTVFEYGAQRRSTTEANTAPATGRLAQFDEGNGRQAGLLIRIINPGDVVTEVLERDEALRPTKMRITDGDVIRRIDTRSNWRSLPENIEVESGTIRRRLRYEYNAGGLIQTVIQPGDLRSTFEYDQAGRVVRITLPDGSGVTVGQDTEDRVSSVARVADMGLVTPPPVSSVLFRYDRHSERPSQLTGIADTVSVLHSYRYNDIGQVVAMTNAIGVNTTIEYDANGRVATRTDAAGSMESSSIRFVHDNAGQAIRLTAPNDVSTVRRYDDFGRKVFEADPDRGVTLFRYDTVGRVLARIDETGTATRYTYDNAGRLLTVGKNKVSNLLQYRYRGSRPISMLSTPDGNTAHATERLEYQYDAFGQLTRESRWIADVTAHDEAAVGVPPRGLLFVTQFGYDDAGRVIQEMLPDGHSLRYLFTPGGKRQRTDTKRRPGQLEAILFDDQVVVADIEHTIAGGLTGYTMSNGVRQQIQLDRRARVTQLRTIASSARPNASWWRRFRGQLLTDTDSDEKLLYRQVNRYDEADRLVQTERQLITADAGTLGKTRREGYAYDQISRLTTVISNDGVSDYYRYDKAGNRVAKYGHPVSKNLPATASSMEWRNNYAPGRNRLLASTGQSAGSTAPPFLSSTWLYHPTGIPLAQLKWAADAGLTSRRLVYNTDKRPVAVYEHGELLARYHYNSRGERIAKTIFSAQPRLTSVAHRQTARRSDTTYSLYRGQRLGAEADRSGNITTHYVYLYGKPVAKIEMTKNLGVVHRALKAFRIRDKENVQDTLGRIYSIVTDQLGTPQEVLDEEQLPVWQAVVEAFGQAHVLYAKTGANGKPFQMNLRLPGQVYDAETGLHYNYFRDYDPQSGRYITPDPAGLSGGTNPFVYVSSNPLTNTDVFGLYQSDMHYYMTFFLAVTAGVNPHEARVIALATQYIDDNPDTKPLNLEGGVTDAHRARLLTYHFTMVPSTVDHATGLVLGGPTTYGSPPVHPSYGNVPENAQLGRLNAAIAAAGSASNLRNSRCTQLQLFGEYLHAFEDTFSHRDSNDMPFALSVGLGHGAYGSNPDYTYNHRSAIPIPGHFNWNTNEDRTLQAEREVFAKMATWGDATKAKDFATIEQFLKEFNAVHEHEAGGETTEERQNGYPNKIAVLQLALVRLGYADVNILAHGNYSFNTQIATENRNSYLRDRNGNPLDQRTYSGTILPK